MKRPRDLSALSSPASNRSPLVIDDNARVAVLGGGPAGSFFAYFLLDLADRTGSALHVDIYEPRDFSGVGPASCNMCGGIISESLVQNLAAEGITLPSTVVQRGIDSYMLHMDVGSVRIETPLQEMRIGAMHRAGGPRSLKEAKWVGFDEFLQKRAMEKGARLMRDRVEEVTLVDGRPCIRTRDATHEPYDLMAVASGVNSKTLEMFAGLDIRYRAPVTTKTFMREYYFGEDTLGRFLKSSMHVFLLNIPGLEFGAIIPKGDYASLCLLGQKIDRTLLNGFLGSAEVQRCMPPDWDASQSGGCQCSPRIATRGALNPFADRIVFIGDAGVTRLYKDGIGAAYRTAKAAATTAVFQGVAAEDFRKHYWPLCRDIERDNNVGKFVFAVTTVIQRYRVARHAVLNMVRSEQFKPGRARRMSQVLWDLFTGSATYREILRRTLHPVFIVRLSGHLVEALVALPFRGRALRSFRES